MDEKITAVAKAMADYYKGDDDRIKHFLKVFSYAKTLGQMEKLDEKTQQILEISALVHDIGIKLSVEKHNSTSGRYQQLEGPAEAEKLLQSLDFDSEIISRVSYLVAHHHTYKNIEGMDYQLLVEADFLVNINDMNMNRNQAMNIKKKVFKTPSGMAFMFRLYGV